MFSPQPVQIRGASQKSGTIVSHHGQGYRENRRKSIFSVSAVAWVCGLAPHAIVDTPVRIDYRVGWRRQESRKLTRKMIWRSAMRTGSLLRES